jgi:uncharacterized membrane protein YeaQ/YmgE (transglycosylase-associated protein family)
VTPPAPTPTPGPALTIALTPDLLTRWLVLLLIAALAGLLIEVLRGGAMPLGPLGGIAAGLLGAWLGAEILAAQVALAPQIAFDGVPLVPAAIGALVLALGLSLLGGSRHRGYY